MHRLFATSPVGVGEWWQVKDYICEQLRSLRGDDGRLSVAEPASPRRLACLRRTCHAVHQSLANTLISGLPQIKALIQRIWDSSQVEIPLSLQAASVRVKVVEVKVERERQRKAHTYPAAVTLETVLMQYIVDTQLDRALAAAFEVRRPSSPRLRLPRFSGPPHCATSPGCVHRQSSDGKPAECSCAANEDRGSILRHVA